MAGKNDVEFRIGAQLAGVREAFAALRGDIKQTTAEAAKLDAQGRARDARGRFLGQGNGGAGGGGRGPGTGPGGGAEDVQRLSAAVTGAIGQVKALFAALAALGGVVQVIRLADELQTLQARIKLVTGDTEAYVQAQVKLFDIAQSTRSSLTDTIDLFVRVGQATKDAKVGQETLLSVVQTINQATQLSGASAESAKAAIIQLGQGLGSGTLRGEELNSVLEQTPVLADAIAQGMKITRAELRQFGEQGKLTSQEVIKALVNQKGVIDQQFQSLPLTVGQATTRLKNSLLALLGTFNEVAGGTSSLAKVINDFATALGSDQAAGAAAEIATAWGNAFAGIATDAKNAITVIKEATKDFLGDGLDLFQFLFNAIRDLPSNLRAVVRIITVTVAGMVDSFVADFKFLAEAIKAIFTDDTFEAAITRRNARVNAAAEIVKQTIDEITDETKAAQAEARKAGQEVEERKKKARAAQGSASLGSVKPLQPVIDNFAILKAAAEIGIKEVQAVYQAAQIGLQDYLQRRVALQQQAIDAEIAMEQKKLELAIKARKQDDANQSATNIAKLQLERKQIQSEADREREQAERDLAEKILAIRADVAEREGDISQAATTRIVLQYKDLLARLDAEGDTEGRKIVEKLINTDIARARMQEILQAVEQANARLQQRLAEIADQRSTNSIGGGEAAQQESEARRQATSELEALNVQLGDLAKKTNDPEIIKGAQQLTANIRAIKRDGLDGVPGAIADLTRSLDQMRKNLASTIAGSAVDNLTELFTSIADGSKSAGEALRDFVRGFAKSMAEIAARALATFLVLQVLDAIYPGLGKTVAAAGGVGAKHLGGMAGSGPRDRKVSPLIFAGAPRLHSGGFPGLAANEVPAILKMGEEVLTPNDPRNALNGGGAPGGGGIRVINAISERSIASVIGSAHGEKEVLNVIGKNAGAIRQLIER